MNTDPHSYVNYQGIDYKIRERFTRPHDDRVWLRLMNTAYPSSMRKYDKVTTADQVTEPKFFVKSANSVSSYTKISKELADEIARHIIKIDWEKFYKMINLLVKYSNRTKNINHNAQDIRYLNKIEEERQKIHDDLTEYVINNNDLFKYIDSGEDLFEIVNLAIEILREREYQHHYNTFYGRISGSINCKKISTIYHSYPKWDENDATISEIEHKTAIVDLTLSEFFKNNKSLGIDVVVKHSGSYGSESAYATFYDREEDDVIVGDIVISGHTNYKRSNIDIDVSQDHDSIIEDICNVINRVIDGKNKVQSSNNKYPSQLQNRMEIFELVHKRKPTEEEEKEIIKRYERERDIMKPIKSSDSRIELEKGISVDEDLFTQYMGVIKKMANKALTKEELIKLDTERANIHELLRQDCGYNFNKLDGKTSGLEWESDGDMPYLGLWFDTLYEYLQEMLGQDYKDASKNFNIADMEGWVKGKVHNKIEAFGSIVMWFSPDGKTYSGDETHVKIIDNYWEDMTKDLSEKEKKLLDSYFQESDDAEAIITFFENKGWIRIGILGKDIYFSCNSSVLGRLRDYIFSKGYISKFKNFPIETEKGYAVLDRNEIEDLEHNWNKNMKYYDGRVKGNKIEAYFQNEYWIMPDGNKVNVSEFAQNWLNKNNYGRTELSPHSFYVLVNFNKLSKQYDFVNDIADIIKNNKKSLGLPKMSYIYREQITMAMFKDSWIRVQEEGNEIVVELMALADALDGRLEEYLSDSSPNKRLVLNIIILGKVITAQIADVWEYGLEDTIKFGGTIKASNDVILYPAWWITPNNEIFEITEDDFTHADWVRDNLDIVEKYIKGAEEKVENMDEDDDDLIYDFMYDNGWVRLRRYEYKNSIYLMINFPDIKGLRLAQDFIDRKNIVFDKVGISQYDEFPVDATIETLMDAKMNLVNIYQRGRNMVGNIKADRRYKGIGIYWSWDREAAACHWGKSEEKGYESILLIGRVTPESINVEKTLLLNMSSYSEEKELRLYPNTKVEVVGYEYKGKEEMFETGIIVKARSLDLWQKFVDMYNSEDFYKKWSNVFDDDGIGYGLDEEFEQYAQEFEKENGRKITDEEQMEWIEDKKRSWYERVWEDNVPYIEDENLMVYRCITVRNPLKFIEDLKSGKMKYSIQQEVSANNIQVGYDYSCLMVDLPINLKTKLQEFSEQNIPNDVLYVSNEEPDKYGREDEFHITVKYGLTETNFELFKEYLKPVNISLGKISKFYKDDYDVVKVEVISNDLNGIHKNISDNFENYDEHPIYQPHITLAYVKRGECENLVGDIILPEKSMGVEEEFMVNDFYFTTPNEQRFELSASLKQFKEFEHIMGEHHVRMTCGICGDVHTCRCKAPKFDVVGICYECYEKQRVVANKTVNIKELDKMVEQKYPDVQLWTTYHAPSNSLTVNKIIVPKEKRNQGIGTDVMNMVREFADKNGLTITLTPSGDFGGNKAKLQKWYRSMGFKKNTDFRFSESMAREPLEAAKLSTDEDYYESLKYDKNFIKDIKMQDDMAESMFSKKAVVETSGNIYIKYIETEEAIIVLGINSKLGKLSRADIKDMREWLRKLEDKINNGKTLYTSVNDNSYPFIKNMLKDNPGWKLQEIQKIDFPQGQWVNIMITANFIKADVDSKMEYLMKPFYDKYIKEGKTKEEAEDLAIDRVLECNEADITGKQGVYTQWIIKLVINNNIKLPEDNEKVKQILKRFDMGKKNPKFPLNKDINSYKTYSDLAEALDSIPQEEAVSKGEKERKEVAEGTKTIYKDEVWEIIELSTPKATHDICYNLGAIHWCVKDESYAMDYLRQGKLYAFIKNGKAYALFHKQSQQFMDFYDNPISTEKMKEMYPLVQDVIGVIIPEFDKTEYDIDTLIDKSWDLRKVFEKYGNNMTKEQIDKAIDKGEDLEVLYKYAGNNMTKEQIDKAIDKGEDLEVLYEYAGNKMTNENIDKAIDKGIGLYSLYEYVGKKMTNENIDKAIDKGEDLEVLYEYAGNKMTNENIDKAIDKGIGLYSLYEYVGNNMTKEQIDKAIDKGIGLYSLYEYAGNNMTKEQIDKAIDKAIDKGIGLYYLYKYAGNNMSKNQIQRLKKLKVIIGIDKYKIGLNSASMSTGVYDGSEDNSTAEEKYFRENIDNIKKYLIDDDLMETIMDIFEDEGDGSIKEKKPLKRQYIGDENSILKDTSQISKSNSLDNIEDMEVHNWIKKW